MYDYSANLTYTTLNNNKRDGMYKKEFLNLFGLEFYNGEVIMKTIGEINEKYKDNEKLIKILDKTRKHKLISMYTDGSIKNVYFLLFSYDYMNLFHKCLQELNLNGNISDESHKVLMNNIILE